MAVLVHFIVFLYNVWLALVEDKISSVFSMIADQW